VIRARRCAAVAMTVMGATAGLAACGKTTTSTVTQVSTSTTATTTTRTRTHHAGTLTIHVTSTETVTHTPGPVAAQGQTSSSGVLTLTGVGTENMGTVRVPTQSLLKWSCASCGGANFQINNSPSDGSTVDVNGLNQTSGQTVLDAGTYHDFEINTEGPNWTVTIGPS
jgi:hypothetical protein